MTELPDECDYCDCTLEEDEELEPVFIGAPPKPQPMVISGTATACESIAGWKDASGELHQLERPVGEAQAILDALSGCELVEVGSRPIARIEQDGRSWGMEHDTGEIVAEIVIESDFDEPAPDLMVCEYCKESLGGEK